MTFSRHFFPVVFLLTLPCFAGDWPTYRYDATRSACTENALPAVLKPEAQVLEAELRAARGEAVGGRLRSLHKTYPELRWWIGEVRGGCSTLRSLHPDEPWWPSKTRSTEACR